MSNLQCPPGCVARQFADQIISATADLSFFLDGAGVIQDVGTGDQLASNGAWKQLVGRKWVDTTAPDSQAKVDQLLKEARSGTVPRARQINQRTENGQETPFRFAAVYDGNSRVVALGRDLSGVATLHRQMVSAQQATDREFERMRQAGTRYRILFNASSEGVLILDGTTLKVVEANQAAGTLFDEPVASLLGRSLDHLFDGPTGPMVQAQVVTALATGRAPDNQIAMLRQGRTLNVSVTLFRQGAAAFLLMRLGPATSGQGSMGSREARMVAMVDAMPDGIVLMGEDRRILSANNAFCEMVQQAQENQVVGQPLERWLGRPGVDLNIMLANMKEHGVITNFSTVIRGEHGGSQEASVSGVSALGAKVPVLGFAVRTVPERLSVLPVLDQMPRSVEQLRGLVGRVALKEIVRESADLIERLCIEAALRVSGDNRASAAQLLGLSRQGLYTKMRRHGLGDLEPLDDT